MRLFSSPRWTRCSQVSRMALVVSMMLASFQLLAQAQGEERPVEHPTFHRTIEDEIAALVRSFVDSSRLGSAVSNKG
jgi:hypothetical protein